MCAYLNKIDIILYSFINIMMVTGNPYWAVYTI